MLQHASVYTPPHPRLSGQLAKEIVVITRHTTRSLNGCTRPPTLAVCTHAQWVKHTSLLLFLMVVWLNVFPTIDYTESLDLHSKHKSLSHSFIRLLFLLIHLIFHSADGRLFQD